MIIIKILVQLVVVFKECKLHCNTDYFFASFAKTISHVKHIRHSKHRASYRLPKNSQIIRKIRRF